MEIILTAFENPDLEKAWKQQCSEFDFVTFETCSILETDAKCVVSSANSFGFMEGGLDYQYTKHFGSNVQKRVQHKIINEFNGELLVGQAIMVQTGDDLIPYLIAAPTMRMPVTLPHNTVNPYLATKAALVCAKENNIESIAFPGLGTGVGQVMPQKCALQIAQAIREVILEEREFPKMFADAIDQHTYLYTGLKHTQKLEED